MTLRSIIQKFLSNTKVQRLCYFSALILWLFLWSDDFLNLNSISSLGIKYFWLISIPASLLFFQTIFNNQVFWAIIFGLFLTYSIYAVYAIIAEMFERTGHTVKPITWDLLSILVIIMFLAVLFLINWIIFNLKPNRTNKFLNH